MRKITLRGLVAASLAVGMMAAGCKSHKKAAPGTGSSAPQPAVTTDPSTPTPTPPPDSGSVEIWDEAPAAASGATADHVREPFEAPPPAPPPAGAAADAIIARFETECPKGTSSPTCDDLRLQVERILLDNLIGLRAANQVVDREWFRVAARAALPELACIGVRELALAPDRSAAEEALVVAAVDSPFNSVRNAAFEGRAVAAVNAVRDRTQWRDSGPVVCLDGSRDLTPGGKWAGGYPGARFRYFASGPSLRWFTTDDPLDKVLAYFAKSGRPALTAQENQMAETQKRGDEMNRIVAEQKAGEEEKTQARLMQIMNNPPTDWSTPFHGWSNADEIRYVMIGPNQAIAIFHDDVLHATSIVAARPPVPPETDAEKAKRQARARTVYGF